MLVRVLKDFRCAVDLLGVTFRDLEADGEEDIRDDLVAGLVAEGYVTSVNGAAPPGVIPANWRDLHWKQRVKLARDLGAPDDVDVERANVFIEAKSVDDNGT